MCVCVWCIGPAMRCKSHPMEPSPFSNGAAIQHQSNHHSTAHRHHHVLKSWSRPTFWPGTIMPHCGGIWCQHPPPHGLGHGPATFGLGLGLGTTTRPRPRPQNNHSAWASASASEPPLGLGLGLGTAARPRPRPRNRHSASASDPLRTVVRILHPPYNSPKRFGLL